MSALRQALAQVPAILALAVPIVVGLLASTLLGVTDSIMLAPLGPVPLAAVGLTNAVALILFATVYGVLSALSVRIGHAHGAGAGRSIAGMLRSGLVLGGGVGIAAGVIMGVVWFALPYLGQPPEVLEAMPAYYFLMAVFMLPFALLFVFTAALEAVGRPWLGTGFAFVGVVVNIPLNYVLIWGLGPIPALGLTGAGIGTVLAQSVALAVAWVMWLRAPSLRRLRVRQTASLPDVMATAREGLPMGLMYLAETGAVAVATVMIGTFGTIALAANQVALSVGSLAFMVPLGTAGAVAIRVAQESGAGNRAVIRPVAFAALGVATGWLILMALILGFGGTWIAGMIVADPEVVAVAGAIMLVFALTQVFDGLQSTMLGALRGLSDAGWAAGVSMLAYWPFGLPLGWAFAHWWGFGPAGVWMGWLVALAWAGCMLVGRFLWKTR
jgi:multidrug resistance protein, MATE family